MSNVDTACKRIFHLYGGLMYDGVDYPRHTQREINWTNYSHRGAGYPDWKARKAAGLDVTTSLDAFNRSLVINPNGSTIDSYGAWPNHSYTTGSTQCQNTTVVPGGVFSDFDLSLRGKAVDQAYINFVRSYQKAVQTVQGGQFIGELRETINFLKSPAKSLETLTRHYLGNMRDINLRYRDIDKYSAWLGAATGSFLSWQFGAKPLLSDIADGKKALDQLSSDSYHKKGQRFVGTGEAVQVEADGFASPGGYYFGDIQFGSATWFPWKRTRTITAKIRGGLLPRTGTNLADFPLDSLGLGIENWVPTVYECVPFSWLADYFSNLGDLVSASSFAFVNLNWSNMTVRQCVSTVAGPLRSGLRPDGGGVDIVPSNIYSMGGGVVDIHKLVSRGGMPSGHYFPDLRFKLPGLGQSLNFTAVLNELTSRKGLKPFT